jgi:hypothetical protein
LAPYQSASSDYPGDIGKRYPPGSNQWPNDYRHQSDYQVFPEETLRLCESRRPRPRQFPRIQFDLDHLHVITDDFVIDFMAMHWVSLPGSLSFAA